MSTAERPTSPRDAAAGCALLVTAIVGVILMALHPTGREIREASDPSAVLWRNGIVHGLLVAVALLQTWGSIAIVRRLRRSTVGLAELAFVAQGAAVLGATVAAMCSGFVMPRLLAHLDAEATAPARHVIWLMNQAFAQLFTIAGSAAIVGWSLAGWRRSLHRGTALLGILVGGGVALLVSVGHLRLHVHGMGAILLVHEIWWGCVGIELLRSRSTP